MKEGEERGLYLTQKIKNIAYNAKFKAMKYLEEYNNNFLTPGDEIHILGKKFVTTQQNLAEVQTEIYQLFMRTPWITYRAGFPQLPNQLVGSYVSDTGWGCMVRVGQMLFAQIIKHHQNITDKEQIVRVLNLFSDFDKKQPFSIHNIARLARIQYGLKPGDWYNPSQIAFILSILHQKYLANEIKMKARVFNSGNLFFDVLVEAMLSGKSVCNCAVKDINDFLCSKCNKEQFAISVIVLSRLGLNGPQKKYLSILEKLMQFSCFQGVIGGKPEKALYFVGKHKEQYIYLDPHYVQTAEKDLKNQHDSYFCQSFRKCKNTSIDSSLGICFYLRNIAQFNEFYRNINAVKNQNPEDFFIFVADETPNYAKPKNSSKKIHQEENAQEDIFEML